MAKLSPRWFRTVFLTFIFLSLLAGTALAGYQRPETPTSLPGGGLIDSKYAKVLLDSGKTIFFDMRSPLNFGKGHIMGATSLPYRENSQYSPQFDAAVDVFDIQKLPVEKTTPIVFYSHGTTGWKSYKAAVLAIK